MAEPDMKSNVFWAYLITGLLLVTSLGYYSFNPYFIYLVVYIWFGFAYGMMLQYGRFCMASASRDLFAAGVPRMAVGVLVALMFFSLIQATLASTNMSTFHPAPFGIHTLIAGLIFGVGMVLSGGCASGSLYKIGEGNMTSAVVAFFGLCVGQAVFVDVKWFDFMMPASWKAAAAAKVAQGVVPADKLTSSFDTFLAGYVWDQPTIQMSHTKAVAAAMPGISKYFIADSLICTLIPSLVVLATIYYYLQPQRLLEEARQEPRAGR